MTGGFIYFAVIAIVCIIFGSIFGTGVIKVNTQSPTLPPSLKPTLNPTSNPSLKPTKKPTSLSPTSNPTLNPSSTSCVYLEGNAGVGVEVTVTPSPGSFGSMEFYRDGGVFVGIVTFNYLNGEIKGFFNILLNFSPPRPTQAEFRFSTSSSASNTTFPIIIPIPEGVTEFESPWLTPDGCTPLPCTQTLYLFGRIPYCPIPTQAPSKTPTTEYEAGKPTLSPTIPE